MTTISRVDVDDPSYVGHKPCPKCGSRDNVYRYPDGHEFCFGRCGYVKLAPVDNKTVCALLKAKQQHEASLPNNVEKFLPDFADDCTNDLKDPGLTWLKKYGIHNDEIKEHDILWSQSQEQLVFPIYNENYFLIAWQARNFNPKRKKYFTAGQMDDILHIIGLTKHGNPDNSGGYC